MAKYTFSTPFEFEGKKYEFIEYDLGSLKGSDIASVKRQFSKDGNFSVIPAMDSEFCALILAKVAKLPLEFFNELPANDYCKITQEVGNFLMS